MTSATLEKLQCAARANAVRRVYLDETGLAASPPVQRAWSPRGRPQCIEPRSHSRRSELDSLDFGADTRAYHVASSSIKGDAVIEFIEQIALPGDERPTVLALDNASIHHAVDPEVHERWRRGHRMQVFYLSPCDQRKSLRDRAGLNLIETLWKHTIEDEVRKLSTHMVQYLKFDSPWHLEC